MKAITILQPWASLIALGEKRFETRSWPTKHRGSLAIHAGKKVDREICEQEPFRSVLAKHGYTADNLPTGAVVAVSELRECFKVFRDVLGGVVILESEKRKTHFSTLDNEFHFGWYEKGRFAWELTDVRRLPEPIPAKGQQRLWNWGGRP
ncbi:ASCH domain-containing protein [Paenibacillus sp. FSL R5-0527]|uniref:ASCH domain-containing protein n=1 Tax=Paenibacillus sp. FSL R5-0527 TaxID=2975321 RepID=UPI00097AE6BE|nr:2-oxoglutarate dehydrogenase E1 [Paenibacillus macerans]